MEKVMSNALTKKRSRAMLLVITISILMGSVPVASCTNGQIKQPEAKTSQQAVTQPKETPIPLQPTKENGGIRCEPRIYTQVKGDEDYNPFCYRVQLKLVDAAEEGNLDKMKEALREGASPDGSVYYHLPPLHMAASSGKTSAVSLLLDNGADVNRVIDIENTPLSTAVVTGHIDVVRVLLERGANVCYRSSEGTAEEIARNKGYHEIAKILQAAKSTNCKQSSMKYRQRSGKSYEAGGKAALLKLSCTSTVSA